MDSRRSHLWGRWLPVGIIVAAVLVTWGVMSASDGIRGVRAMGAPVISGEVARVPARWDVEVQPLAAADLPRTAAGLPAVTGEMAIEAAKAAWGLTDADIDPQAGAVHAVLSQRGDPRHQGMKVWVVTADVDVRSQGMPSGPHFITHKLCVVVDARTGRYLFAYAAGPKDWLKP